MTIHFHPPKLPWPFTRREATLTEPAPSTDPNGVVPLTPPLAHDLRLAWASRWTNESLARYVGQGPGWAWAVPGAGEYMVAEAWRQRDDVALLSEIHARRYRAELVQTACEGLAGAGVGALLVPDMEWTLHSRLYQELGFGRIERVITYQLNGLRLPLPLRRPLPELRIAPVIDSTIPVAVDVDHASFPWLWRNSLTEFRHYFHSPAVQVVLGYVGEQAVGYAGFTISGSWGHLDRLAVVASVHGRGWGAALLAYTLTQMARRGVTRVTLSTQETNTQSQRLYQGFGFRATSEAHLIYGKVFAEGDNRV